jgi:hypothetical protein
MGMWNTNEYKVETMYFYYIFTKFYILLYANIYSPFIYIYIYIYIYNYYDTTIFLLWILHTHKLYQNL